MVLTVLRHPAVAAEGLCYGRSEVPLAPGAGAAIAAAVARTPAPVRLISSPSARCRALGQALAGAHGVALETDARLMELDFGAWEGRAWAAIPRAESDPWAEDPERRAPPGGESFATLLARVRDAVAGLGPATLVTHAGPVRALWMMGEGMGFQAAFRRPVPHAEPMAIRPPSLPPPS